MFLKNLRFRFLAIMGIACMAFTSPYSHAKDNSAPHEKIDGYNGYMGFTPWPYDLTIEAQAKTYDFITENGTIISHHLDNGIPWEEALREAPLPSTVIANWKKRKQNSSSDLKIFLSITPINFSRDGLSGYWNEAGDNQPLPERWKGKSFDDPQTVKAFTNYALKAIDYFDPDYLAIGIEANIMISKSPQKWDSYITLNRQVYKNIKTRYPTLPVFSTIQYEHLRGIEDDSKKNHHLQFEAVKKMMKHSDFLALSTYKYGFLHPNKPKEGYFEEALSFGKPIAIAETGAMSKTTLVMGIPLLSNQKDQKKFLEMILQNAAKHEFVFVINWVPIDFNKMLPKIPSAFRGIAKAWVHSGLLDKKFKPKPAFEVWRKYLGTSVRSKISE